MMSRSSDEMEEDARGIERVGRESEGGRGSDRPGAEAALRDVVVRCAVRELRERGAEAYVSEADVGATGLARWARASPVADGDASISEVMRELHKEEAIDFAGSQDEEKIGRAEVVAERPVPEVPRSYYDPLGHVDEEEATLMKKSMMSMSSQRPGVGRVDSSHSTPVPKHEGRIALLLAGAGAVNGALKVPSAMVGRVMAVGASLVVCREQNLKPRAPTRLSDVEMKRETVSPRRSVDRPTWLSTSSSQPQDISAMVTHAVKVLPMFYSDTATEEKARDFWKMVEDNTERFPDRSRLLVFSKIKGREAERWWNNPSIKSFQTLKGRFHNQFLSRTADELWDLLETTKRGRGESVEEWGDRMLVLPVTYPVVEDEFSDGVPAMKKAESPVSASIDALAQQLQTFLEQQQQWQQQQLAQRQSQPPRPPRNRVPMVNATAPTVVNPRRLSLGQALRGIRMEDDSRNDSRGGKLEAPVRVRPVVVREQKDDDELKVPARMRVDAAGNGMSRAWVPTDGRAASTSGRAGRLERTAEAENDCVNGDVGVRAPPLTSVTENNAESVPTLGEREAELMERPELVVEVIQAQRKGEGGTMTPAELIELMKVLRRKERAHRNRFSESKDVSEKQEVGGGDQADGRRETRGDNDVGGDMNVVESKKTSKNDEDENGTDDPENEVMTLLTRL
ncbi:unnamed protein product [Phytophthora fragariaefolia]|uniref:Unnamed protein product n=1 Tax=Phytophthora fragariaefolia TaxID=1490495 RepID=A0A9W6XQM4_9STRA|nr:unnamed protein product [Phytophthora fragariaefolia]